MTAHVLQHAETPRTIRVVVAHDSPIARAGLAALLEREPGVDVVGLAADGVQAAALARGVQPDVVLLAVHLDAVETTRRVRAASSAAVMIFGASAHDGRVFPALRAGASGLVLADREPAELIRGVRMLAHGGRLLTGSPRNDISRRSEWSARTSLS